MATNLSIPNASVRFTLEDGRPNPDWYRILARLVGLFNDTTASLDDTSTGLDSKLSQGKHTIWVPAGAMVDDGSGNPAAVTTTLSGNRLRTLDFDQTTLEVAQFQIGMPKSWDGGAITLQPYWTAASGSGGVNWFFSAHAVSNDDTLSFNYSTFVGSTDTLIATNDLHIGPVSGNLTPSGSPADEDLICFSVGRNPSDVSDTLNADAKLIGITIFYTINAGNDE